MSGDPSVYRSQKMSSLRPRIRRYFSPVLFSAGLLLLVFSFFHREIPLVKAGSITSSSDEGYIGMSGVVREDAHIGFFGEMSFCLDDGTGEITVTAGRVQTERLKELDRVPRAGDRVVLTGILKRRPGRNVQLRMKSPEEMDLLRNPVSYSVSEPEVAISSVTGEKKGEIISTSGVLQEIVIPGPGSGAPYIFRMEDGAGMLDVVCRDSVFQAMGRILPAPGTRFAIRGRVELYKGRPQLRLRSAADFVPFAAGNHTVEKIDA